MNTQSPATLSPSALGSAALSPSALGSAALSPSALGTAALSPHADWLSIVRAKADAIRYGTIQLVIHEGRITQIESTEKTRLENKGAPAACKRN